jgi:hypothetical protein
VKLSSPLPVPSPLIVVLVIHDRDSTSPLLRDDIRDQLRCALVVLLPFACFLIKLI